MDIAVFSTGMVSGMAACWLLDWLAELIARRANRMQPIVLPPDAASDLSLGRSADRESLAKLKIIIEQVWGQPSYVSKRGMFEAGWDAACVKILECVESELGPEPSESQDAMEKA